MATKKQESPAIDKEVLGLLQPLADALKVGVTELWSIFVRQFVVKGLNEVFMASIFIGAALLLKDHVGYFALIPVGIAIVLIFDAINLLGNPKYYALSDIGKKVSDLRDER